MEFGGQKRLPQMPVLTYNVRTKAIVNRPGVRLGIYEKRIARSDLIKSADQTVEAREGGHK